MGYSGTRVTVDIYGHLMQTESLDAASREMLASILVTTRQKKTKGATDV